MAAPVTSTSGIDWKNLSNEQIENYFGQQDDIKAARAADPNFNLGQWYQTSGKQEVLDGRRNPTGIQTLQNTVSSAVTNPTLPTGTTYTPVNQVAQANEMQKGPGELPVNFNAAYYLQNNPDVAEAAKNSGMSPEEFAYQHWKNYGQVEGRQGQASAQQQTQQVTAQTVSNVDAKQAATYDATKVAGQTPQMQAAQGTVSDKAQVQAAQGTTSDAFNKAISDNNARIDAETLDPKATVQKQFADLMSGDMAWAKGALREANAALAARGMGASSIAGEAISMAVLSAALPIATADAKAYQTLQLEKMSEKQATALLNASTIAQMDLKNLDNRQQAAVVNAQSFLQMDLANLSNQQQAAVVNTQARIQTLLSDQAAENAAKQFNAASQNQMTQFYDQLNAQINMYNTSQVNAAAQFNAGQVNAMTQFQQQLANSREQFNAQMYFAVEQSNVNYLRQINTQNTAKQNEANYINSQNLLQISNTALANAIQQQRDEYAFNWQASQNAINRAENRALMILNRDFQMQLNDRKAGTALSQSIGSFATNVVGGVLNNWKNIFG